MQLLLPQNNDTTQFPPPQRRTTPDVVILSVQPPKMDVIWAVLWILEHFQHYYECIMTENPHYYI